jgi:hypothetical protein
VAEPDDEAVRRAIVIPKRGVGKGAFEHLDAFATKHGISLATAFERAEEAGVTSAAMKGIRSFLELRSTMRGRTGEGAATVLRATLEASGYLAELRSADEEDRLGNLESLFTVLDEFASIDEMVEELDRIADLESQPKPRTASLFQTMTLERITFEDAMQLLSLPRTVGVDPADGVEVTVQNGKFGPYLTKGSDSRSLDNEEQLLTVTLDECLTILAQPKKYGRARTKPPLRELGTDPHSDRTILLKDGQYGPYVTDGETNASLRRGDSVEEISDERAAELLAERRAKGPAKKKPRRRKS